MLTLLFAMFMTSSVWAADITQNSAVVINNGNKSTYEGKSIAGTVPSNSTAGSYRGNFVSPAAVVVDGIELNLTIDGFNANYSERYSPLSGISLVNSAKLHLTILGTNTLQGGFGGAGIYVAPGCLLVITSASTGTLNAYGGSSYGGGAGIGSNGDHMNTQTQADRIIPQGCGDIVINGGTINAKGASWYYYFTASGGAAGIGSGEYSGLSDKEPSYGDNTYVNNITGNITINGGTVNASGGVGAAGIGGGNCGTVKSITINGGTVTATGKTGGSAIGLGSNNSNTDAITLTCPTITLAGGTITANGNIGYGSAISSERNVGGSVTIAPNVTLNCSASIAPFQPSTLASNSYVDADGTIKTASNPKSAYLQETLTTGWWVVDKYTEIKNRIVVNGTVNLILNEGITLKACKGIQVFKGNTLNVYAQLNGTGSIIATGDSGNSGIGGGYVSKRSGEFEDKSCGTINIYGGTIETVGGSYGAGIGTGYIKSQTTDGGTINIYGGSVTATGNDGGAGIGGGRVSDAGKFTNPQTVHIYGGNVKAYAGGWRADGIGRGYDGKDGDIVLEWKNMSDSIYASSYGGNVSFNSGFMLADSETGANLSNIGGQTIVPPVVASLDSNNDNSDWIWVNAAYMYKYILPACPFTPVHGKAFDKWEANGQMYNVGDELVLTGRTYIKAIWKEGDRTVTFNTNGHGTAPDPQVLEYNTKATEPAALIADGYTFGGWYKEKSCINRWEFSATEVTEDMTLYAKWSTNAYTISYTMNEGTNSGSNPLIYTTEDATIELVAPTRKGYSFLGWTYEGQDTPLLEVSIPTGSTGNKAFTANWQINQYTITFDTDGGTPSEVASLTLDYGATVTAPNVTLNKSKCLFDGWEGLPATMPAENITVTAFWAALYHYKTVAPTCTSKGFNECYYGLGRYWSENPDGISYTQVNRDDYVTPATGHSWGEPEWSWSVNNRGELTARIRLDCTVCHYPSVTSTTTLDEQVIKEPTTTEDGVKRYTATIEVDGTDYHDSHDEPIDRTGVVATIGETGYPYLKSAMEAAQSDDVITLLEDVDDPTLLIGSWPYLYKNLTLDLNGHHVRAEQITIQGSLTLKNGTVKSCIMNDNTNGNNTLTLDNATLDSEGDYNSDNDFWSSCIAWYAKHVAVTNGSKMYITGNTFCGGGDADGFDLTIDATSCVILMDAQLDGYNSALVRSQFAQYMPDGYSLNDEGYVMKGENIYHGSVTLGTQLHIDNGAGNVITELDEIVVPSLDYVRDFAAPGATPDAIIGGEPVDLYTLCLPYTPTTGSGIKYYTLSGSTASALQFVEVASGDVAENTPYLVAVSGAASVSGQVNTPVVLRKESANIVEAGGFRFVGTTLGLTNAEAAAAGAYILQSGNKWGVVDTNHPSVYIPPFRAYIVPTSSGARGLFDTEFGDATAVQFLQLINHDGSEHWYDLNGRRIEKPVQKGIYIHDGRKEVVK